MKVCKKCKYIIKSDTVCPICGGTELTEKFYGMVIILNPEKSELAKLLNITTAGEYALNLK